MGKAKADVVTSIIFVTSDQKEDWWSRLNGKTIGPRSELCGEIAELGGVKLFWMYSSAQFLENAKKFTNAKVSEGTISDLEDISKENIRIINIFNKNKQKYTARDYEFRNYYSNVDRFLIKDSVYAWLEIIYKNLDMAIGFLDFVSETSSGMHGFRIEDLEKHNASLLSKQIINSIIEGKREVDEGNLSKFTIIAAMSESFYYKEYAHKFHDTYNIIKEMISMYPIAEFIFGYVTRGGDFYPEIIELGNPYRAT